MTPEETDGLITHLRSTLGKMEASLDAISEGILWINEKGLIQWCDRAFAEMVGKPPIELLGKELFELMPLEIDGERIAISEHPASQVSRDQPHVVGVYEHANGGIRTYEISASYVDLQHMGFSKVVVIHDISRQVQAFSLLESNRILLRSALKGTVDVISKAVEARDPYTSGHQLRVSSLSRSIAQEMGMSDAEVEGIRLGAIVHDIGKIQVPAEILSKPTRLTSAEYDLVRCHASAGYEILKDVQFPWPIASIAHQHHERMDGSGYPLGIKGSEITPAARIVAVADVVEAMSSHRPYRPGLGLSAALEEIGKHRGSLYDPDVVDACHRIFDDGRYSFEGGQLIEKRPIEV